MEAAQKWGVGTSVIIELRKDAKDGALAAFASSKPERSTSLQDRQVAQSQTENSGCQKR